MSIDFIPINLYTAFYHHAILIIVVILFIHADLTRLGSIENLSFLKILGRVVLVFVILYMGLRPIDDVFVDMTNYAHIFEKLKHNSEISFADPIFENFMLFATRIMTVKSFFFLCVLLYVIPLFIISKKWFKSFWLYSFIFLIASFSFWGYGVNGIRNGIATSLFLLGISRNLKIFQGFWLLLSVGFHFAMVIPALGFVFTNLYKNPKLFITIWILAIPISLFGGNFWESYLSGIGIEESRLDYLTQEVNAEKFSRIGFRWDFLLYSSAPIIVGWYYLFKLKYTDKVYIWLFNTYLFANTFWIFVIRANFSNRFAYLSWFLMGIVIIYPLLKNRIVIHQHKSIGFLLISYYSFTYVMNVLL